jgi:hypothetical protein
VLFKIESEEPALSFDEIMRMNLYTPSRYELLLLREIDLRDYGLFRAMQDVGYEYRARQYDALERLAVLVNEDPGASLEARYETAIDECLDELGWLDGD